MKRVEQVAKDGSVVIDYDDPVVREKVDALFERLFPGEVIRDEKTNRHFRERRPAWFYCRNDHRLGGRSLHRHACSDDSFWILG